MKLVKILVAAFIFSAVFTIPIRAWDNTGHKVVAQIAWKNMNVVTKRAVVDALKTAPSESLIRQNMPANVNKWPTNLNDTRYIELFEFIATWPDFVRKDRDNPRPTDKFHHAVWHFRDVFWNAADNSNASIDFEGEMIDKLKEFSKSGSNENIAVQVSWLVHLVGDSHQPLHCSGRITDDAVERDGDKGGNEFCLQPGCREDFKKLNLHSFWDRTLSRNFAKANGETESAYINRLGDDISRRFPRTIFSGQAGNLDFEIWSDESLEKAKEEVYPSLERNKSPKTPYLRNAVKVTEPSIALAGYRLARLLQNRFGT